MLLTQVLYHRHFCPGQEFCILIPVLALSSFLLGELELHNAAGGQVTFENVVFNYPTQTDKQGLKGVTFTVPAGFLFCFSLVFFLLLIDRTDCIGSSTAIVGTTGAGKTTISRLLFRFYDIKGGNIR